MASARFTPRRSIYPPLEIGEPLSRGLLDLRNRISRDVRTSWLNASTAYNRLAVAQQLLEQSNLALELAGTRYKLGLS
jgi:hypothetical protein